MWPNSMKRAFSPKSASVRLLLSSVIMSVIARMAWILSNLTMFVNALRHERKATLHVSGVSPRISITASAMLRINCGLSVCGADEHNSVRHSSMAALCFFSVIRLIKMPMASRPAALCFAEIRGACVRTYDRSSAAVLAVNGSSLPSSNPTRPDARLSMMCSASLRLSAASYAAPLRAIV